MNTMATRISRSFLLALAFLAWISTKECAGEITDHTLRLPRESNGRLLMSEDASPGEFPFFARWGGCGATLIWEDILLTSASCQVVDSDNVLIGAHTLSGDQENSVTRNVVSRNVHPGFNPDTLRDNFMVLKLDRAVRTLPTVWINPTVAIPEDPDLYVVGFGFTASLVRINQVYERTFRHTVLDTSELMKFGNDDGLRSRIQGSVLQKAKTKIVNFMECNSSDQYAGFIDKDGMICTQDDGATCLGDNGGPLCVMMNGECLQIGIVSFGESCIMGDRPTVFSNVNDGYGWIEKTVCGLSENPPPACQSVVQLKDPLETSFVTRTETETTKLSESPVNVSTKDNVPFPSLSPTIAPSTFSSDMPSDGPSLQPSGAPHVLEHSDMPSDGPSLLPSDKPSLLGSVAPSNSASIADESDQKANTRVRNLQELRYVLPIDFFKVPEEEIVDMGPDGIHLYFWPIGSPNEKLGPCEGDCDTDNDCAEGLYCFQKDLGSGTSVPGCAGFDLSRTDFCTYILEDNGPAVSGEEDANDNASSNLSTDLGFEGLARMPALDHKKLGQCEGDCRSDNDCQDGLFCFRTGSGMTEVPGCIGFNDSGTNVCTNAEPDVASPIPQPPINNFPMLFAFKENPPNEENLPLQRCQGDCDSDSDCARGLVCYTRPAQESTIPGCSGSSNSRTDFCIDPQYIQTSDTIGRISTSTPTSTPTAQTSVDATIPSTESTSATFPPNSPLSDGIIFSTQTPSSAPSSKGTPMPSVSNPFVSLTALPTSDPTSFFAAFTPMSSAPEMNEDAAIQSLSPVAPITSEQIDLESSVLVTVAIYFDPWPEEVSWRINRQSDGVLIANVQVGFYKSPQDVTFEFITLKGEETYIFTIADSGGDGIAGIGILYEIFVADQPELKLVEGDGVFGNDRNHTFMVPNVAEIAPITPNAPTTSDSPSLFTVNIYLIIIFDNWHQETSWEITDANDPNLVVASAAFDTYRAGDSITEEIPIPPGKDYIFTIKDYFQDGIKDGDYVMMTADGEVLFQGDGDFGALREHTFSIPDVNSK